MAGIKTVRIPLRAIVNLLDTVASEHGDVEVDIEIITNIVKGWSQGVETDRRKMAQALKALSEEIAQ